MERAYHEKIAGLLHGLLIRLADRLPNKDVTLIAEFIDANELGSPSNRSTTRAGRGPLRLHAVDATAG